MSEKLKKGSLQQKMPFNPAKVPRTERVPVENWTSGHDIDYKKYRDQIPSMYGHQRTRALNKIFAQTEQRRNPKTQKIEVKLYRGMHTDEAAGAISKDGKTINHTKSSSWSTEPHFPASAAFDASEDAYYNAKDDKRPGEGGGKLISAWVPIHHIVHYPNIIGSASRDTDTADELHDPSYPIDKVKQSHRRSEYEVIVAPNHNSEIHAHELDLDGSDDYKTRRQLMTRYKEGHEAARDRRYKYRR